MSQRPLMQLFQGTVSIAAHQKWGNLQGYLCSHSQDTPSSSLPMCESHQKQKQVMPRCPLRSEFSQKCQLTVWITIISVKYGCHYQHKLTRFPRPDVHPGCRGVSRNFHTKLPVCPHPVNNTCQIARKHPVQKS